MPEITDALTFAWQECQESVCTACRAELKKHNERYTQKKKGELARLDHMIRELALPVSAPQQTWASWHHEPDSTARQELAIKLLQHHLAGAEASEDQAGEGKELRLAISMAIATLVTQLALRRINDAKDKTWVPRARPPARPLIPTHPPRLGMYGTYADRTVLDLLVSQPPRRGR